ncbi:MAG: lasso peptide biosynthesis B2 protein [Desulfobulbaceae bacterium]|nr:lasso peptide biosynthesis B2 protein [Desulfobulbaceae bacterium]
MLALQTLLILLQAMLVRKRGGTALRLPPVATVQASLEEQNKLVARVNRLTTLLAGKSRHACFYRSYPLAVLLRKKGVPVQLNIGLMGLGPHQELRGHCWLSAKGKVFNELEAASSLSYPEFLGQGGEGVLYWVNVDQKGAVRSRSAS